MEFKEGDKVKAFGCDGVVVYVNQHTTSEYPIRVSLIGLGSRGQQDIGFTKDGRYVDWHKEPSLILVERPKKKVRIEQWVAINSHGHVVSVSYDTKYDCEKYGRPGRERVIKLISEEEVEIDE